MKKSLGIILALAGSAGTLTGCYGNSNSSNPIVNVPPCTIPTNTIMVYPKPGSRNVPNSTTAIYIASSHPMLDNGNYTSAVQPPNGLPYYYGKRFVQVKAGHVPTPHVTPTFSNPVYYKSVIGGLSSGSNYTIGFNIVNTLCTPAGIGSFTTR